MRSQKKPALSTFEGIITPSGWDKEHRPTDYSFWSFKEEEFRLVFPEDWDSEKIETFFQEEVSITGKVGTNQNGTKTLAVAHLKRTRRK